MTDTEVALKTQGNALFKQMPEFCFGLVDFNQLPTDDLPEIAFVGRSNVGKSSLINAVAGCKIARTSVTPGRTQQFNFFKVQNACYIVDLPGYGFAKAPKKMVEHWTRMIHQYLRGRVQLKRVFLLMDSRHGIKEVDANIMKMLDTSAVSYQIILTKMDKITQKQQETVLADTLAISAKHAACYPEIILTSAEKRIGIEQVRMQFVKLIAGI